MPDKIEQAEALHQRYLTQRRNLDRIIDESQRRIDALRDAHDAERTRSIEHVYGLDSDGTAPSRALAGKPGPAVVAVGDTVDVTYNLPFAASTRAFYDAEVVKIEPDYLHITFDEGDQYRTLKRDRVLTLTDPDTLADVELPA